ncbi:TetR/AcrR family transcriptional regulator [Streptomyces sp. CA-250714]|uniref:TetR/AcrR family transcriptional regulator n=1 Tax=Streptomyces sp. CA-250714 TaxID=3240060 RepID=UPI003D900511
MARTIATVQTPGRRRRSEAKKTAILDAAEALFLTEGYERTGVDAIAGHAQVSKRTVYDHFGDKATLFARVVERAHEAVVGVVRTALDEELTPGRELKDALTAFGQRVITQAVPSTAYVTFQRLTSQPWSTPRLPEVTRDLPERMLEERFAELAANGELRAADPGLAARHFSALTIGLALDELKAGQDTGAEAPTIAAVIADGVDAFLRAYR